MKFSVTYNGNGKRGGKAPVDPNTYAEGDTVTVLSNTGGLTRNADALEYWSTGPDGSTDFLNPGNTFTMGARDVTLYAQWFSTTGLTPGVGGERGVTAHYRFSYNSALRKKKVNSVWLEPSRTNAVMAQCESDFNLMASWFGGISLEEALPVKILIANADGGAGWGPPIHVKPAEGDARTVRSLLVAEVTEMLMKAQDGGWYSKTLGNEQSNGEGLSHFLEEQFQMAVGIPVDVASAFNADLWLNSHVTPVLPGGATYDYGERKDFLKETLPDFSNSPASGCAVLFLYYLHVQLGFDIERIVGAAAPALAGVYKNLTGDSVDPFPVFRAMLDAAYPLTRADGTVLTSAIPGPNPDNPYPLASGLVLSTTRYVRSLGPGARSNDVGALLKASGMRSLRPMLNSRRRDALV